MDLLVLCVACLTVFVNDLVKQMYGLPNSECVMPVIPVYGY